MITKNQHRRVRRLSLVSVVQGVASRFLGRWVYLQKSWSKKHRRSLGNIGKLLLVLYLLATGIFLLTELHILSIIGVLALFAGFFILIGR
jgi:hypothetical protein